MKRAKVLSACVLCLCFLGIAIGNPASQDQSGQEFQVSIENHFSEHLTAYRIWDNSKFSEDGRIDRHAIAELDPGDVIDVKLPFASDQVFIVWHQGEVVDLPIKLNPRVNDRIVLTIDAQKKLTKQLSVRR